MTHDFDVVVLGGGNAGVAAASAAKAAGRSVALVESREVGGTCPLRGCVPKKVLVATAEALQTIALAPEHHISVGPARLDWPKLIERKQTFVDGVPEMFEDMLKGRGIEVVHGGARFLDPHTVAIRTAHPTVAARSSSLPARRRAACRSRVSRTSSLARTSSISTHCPSR